MTDIVNMGVCGGRSFRNYRFLARTLDEICEQRGWITEPDDLGNFLPYVRLIHGGAKGADLLADSWAVTRWCPIMTFPITNDDWKMYGKGAGGARNQRIIDQGKIDILVAFPGGNGTKDMVRRAEIHGIEIIRVEYPTMSLA